MGRRLALLIATYQYQDTGLRQLTAPAHDAEALAAVLRDPEIAGFEVTTLINEPHHRVGEAIGDFYRDPRRDDLTLLYFTGHGLKDDDGRLYLAMTNTRRDSLLFTALSAEQIDQAMEGCRSRQKVLILDCCYSGAFPAGRIAKADSAVNTLERFQGRGRTVLTASDATQYSFEGNQAHGQAPQSVFTRYLVDGLRDGSADLDGDGDISVDELYSYVHDRVVEEMPQQRPKKQDNVEGRTIIAQNINWTLPTYLRNAIGSPIATDRLTALDGLAHLHQIGNSTVRGHVREQIRRLADDDSKQVSASAAARLQSLLPAPPQPPSRQPPGTTESATPPPTALPAKLNRPAPTGLDPAAAALAPTSPADDAPPDQPAWSPTEPVQETEPAPLRAEPVRMDAPPVEVAPSPTLPQEGEPTSPEPVAAPETTPPTAPPMRPAPATATASHPPSGNVSTAEVPIVDVDADPRTSPSATGGTKPPPRSGSAPVRWSRLLPSTGRARAFTVTAAIAMVATIVVVVFYLNNGGSTGSDRPSAATVVTASTTLDGYPGKVDEVMFSPDGAILATGTSGTETTKPAWRLWELATKKSIATLTGVEAAEFSPDGKTLALVNGDGKVRLWDVATRKTRASLPRRHQGTAAMAFNPDGTILATAGTCACGDSFDNPVQLWDVTTGKPIDTLAGHTNGVQTMAFSPDGTTLASGAVDKTVRLWAVATRKTTFTLTAGWTVRFSIDGTTLATSSPYTDDQVRLWDVATGKNTATLGTGRPLAFLNHTTLAVADNDESVQVWDIGTGLMTASLPSGTMFSPDGKTYAYATADSGRLWDLATGSSIAALVGHTDRINDMAFSPDGKTLATASSDKTVRLWPIAR
ncbi:hypothetical protein Acor_49830 [Acrocarpospora corrugata]|uniref:Peptidase C14 caspase domain-containing protein n=1 Tax=Acrocarpospora corrugata TaxID=35763 RepID=A0A5M3W1D0_9ACTN|nr:caspase family protein [Acrocarpospora corrugata]GES02917.1 hypothetical protein Acor_49830 [Acrocarpospora corrugata]